MTRNSQTPRSPRNTDGEKIVQALTAQLVWFAAGFPDEEIASALGVNLRSVTQWVTVHQ